MPRTRLIRLVSAVALAVIVGGVIGYEWSNSRLDRSSKAYSEQSVAQILNAWSDQELLTRASTQFRDAVDPDELHAGFDVLAHRLGMMQSCSAASGSVKREVGKPITALYEVSCRFDRGEATVSISLILAGSEWQILGFTIHSPALGPGEASPDGLRPYKAEQT